MIEKARYIGFAGKQVLSYDVFFQQKIDNPT